MDARTLVRTAAVAGLLAGLTQPAGAAVKPFTPHAIAGRYSGSWTDTDFGTSGPFGFTISSRRHNTVLVLGGTVGGQGFGCPGVPPITSVSLKKGKGTNHWNASGFRLSGAGAFGSVNAIYDHKRGMIRATGTAPPDCAPGVSYLVAGTLRDGALAGNATITLPTLTAHATFEAHRRSL